MAAALRSIDLFLEHGFRVNVLSLPQGHDPDTFLREKGAEAYQERLKSSEPFIDFALRRFMDQKRDPSTPRAKKETVAQIVPYLLKIPDRIERAEYVSLVASRVKLDEQLIRAEMRRAAGKPGPARQSPVATADALVLAERTLLAATLDEDWGGFAAPLVEKELFEGLAGAPIFEKVVELRQQNRKIDILNLRKLLGESECLELLDAVAANASQYPLSEEEIRGSILALQQRRIERETLATQEAITSENPGDLNSPRLRRLLKEKEELRRKQQIQT
jgi:DNA primase